MRSDHCSGCHGGVPDTKKKRDVTSPGVGAGAADSLYEAVDVNNDNQITLAEYIGWVTKTRGEGVAKNATMLTLWIEKFQSCVLQLRKLPEI